MDFPIFHIDFLGDRFIVAMIAILHVIINHALAVGLIPLVTYLEHLGFKRNNDRLDRVAYKIMFVAFIITTTIGAMTGVGIWLSTSLISPGGDRKSHQGILCGLGYRVDCVYYRSSADNDLFP